MAFDVSAKDIARHRWAAILVGLGIEARFLVSKHGPCPICGGKDRFRWDDKDGTGSFFCSQCGAGDGFMLAQKFSGKPFKFIADAIRSAYGNAPVEAKHVERDRPNGEAHKKIWDSAQPPSEGGPLHTYQTKRFGRPWPSNAIREANKFYHPEGKDYFTAMVARVSDPQGNLVNLHVTYLTQGGEKAAVAPNKKVLPGKLPEGSAIRIWPSAKMMGIAEGIETAISAAVLFRMPVWAAINGSMLAKWIPPENAETICVFGDNDENYTGQAKAYALANRLATQFGKQVIVKIPPETGWDWNDRLKSKLANSQAPESQSSQAITMES